MPNGLLGSLSRSGSKNSKIFNGGTLKQPLLIAEGTGKNESIQNHQDLRPDCCGTVIDNILPDSSPSKSCSICEPDYVSREEPPCSEGQRPSVSHCGPPTEEAGQNSLAMVPIESSDSDAGSSFNSTLTLDLPTMRPGWPLLHRAIPHSWQAMETSHVREVSVVEWAMQLPTRHSIAEVSPDHKPMNAELTTRTPATDSLQGGANLNGDSGEIVGIGNATSPSSDNSKPNNPANELEYLHKKYSSVCRFFSYPELQSATSNFSSGSLYFCCCNSV